MNPLTALWRRMTRKQQPDKRSARPRAVRLQAAAVRQQQYNFLHYTGDVQTIHPYDMAHHAIQK